MTAREVADGVWLARGTDVNMVVLREGRDLTLIDSGWPGDVPALSAALTHLDARPEDVRAVLLTHAHLDHVGGARLLHERYDVPVFTHADEVGHAHRDYLEQAGPLDVARSLWRPGALTWTVRIMRVGGLHDVALPYTQPFGSDGALDLPGRPVPVATPGHTSGHVSFLLPASGSVITGDALVTGHPLLPRTGPQLLPALFQHGDPRPSLAALAGLDAGLLLPGHGDPLHVPIAVAVAEALA